jgi:hypothetical protein
MQLRDISVLVGDSHAMQWIPAVAEIAGRRHWRMTSMTKASCSFAAVGLMTKEGLLDDSCLRWEEKVLAEIAGLQPAVVLIEQSIFLRPFGATNRKEEVEVLASAYAARWNELQRGGVRVVVIRDTPRMDIDIPECLTSLGGSIASCSRPRARAMARQDPLVVAATRAPGVTLIDMTDAMCAADSCPPVVGNVLVWRDSHHLTASYAKTMAPALERVLAPFVEARASVPSPINLTPYG